MEIGTKNNNDSYLTIDDNARHTNDRTYTLEFLVNENNKKKVVRKMKSDSVIPRIEFSIILWLNPNRQAPINAKFGETNFLHRKNTGIIVKEDITILVTLCALIKVIISDWPITEKIGDKNNDQPSFVTRIPVGNFCVLDISNANEK